MKKKKSKRNTHGILKPEMDAALTNLGKDIGEDQKKLMKEFNKPKSPNVVRYCGRDVIVVKLAEGKQPFYRSSGHNSGRHGVWFPFDGWTLYPYAKDGWFIKDKYWMPGHALHRYGNQLYKDVSDYLATLDIPEGKVTTDGNEVNEFIKKAKPFTYKEKGHEASH